MRSDRLLSLLLLLQARGRLTAPALARELEVSVRTVYRDVEALSAAGVPVYTEQGRGGGISLMPGYRTDVTGLTPAESRALVAMTGRAVPDDLGLGAALTSAVHKLIAAVPACHRDEAERVRQRVLVDHAGWHRPAPTTPHLATVQDAVWADRRLRVRYRHGDGTRADYQLDPYGLVVKAGVWYLIAARQGRPQLFRVDRVVAAEPGAEPADRPAGLDLAALWERLRNEVEAARDVVRVRLRTWPEAAVRMLRVTAAQRVGDEPTDPVEPDGDGRVLLDVRFRSRETACSALIGFGGAVEVLSPDDLRQDILRMARAVTDLYAPRADPSTSARGPATAALPATSTLPATTARPGFAAGT